MEADSHLSAFLFWGAALWEVPAAGNPFFTWRNEGLESWVHLPEVTKDGIGIWTSSVWFWSPCSLTIRLKGSYFPWASLVAQTIKRLPAIWATWARSLCGKILWRRKWQPTPVPLPGKSHGQRSLIGYSPQSHKELDTTEWLHFGLPWWLRG